MAHIKRLIIECVITIASFFVKNVQYKTSNKTVKVNLGCGLRCLPDWINIDGSLIALLGSKRFKFINKILFKWAGSSEYYSFEEFHSIIQENKLKFYDLRRGVPFKNNGADVIYVSHFLEHLGKKDGKRFLKECYRILKDGGLLRIAIPNLDVAFEMYEKGEVETMLDLFFYTSEYADFSAHKYNYNFAFLKEILEDIGVREVRQRNYREGNCPEIEFLDVCPEHSLYVECIKC